MINLAAFQIRRELIDLARRFNGPLGLATNYKCVSPEISADQSGPAGETYETAPEELDRWSSLHDAVEELPVELREVFGLTYYHAWTQAKIAELFQVDERTVRRRWLAACSSLKTSLGARFPEYGSAE